MIDPATRIRLARRVALADPDGYRLVLSTRAWSSAG
jgi:hypothetical protein